MGLSDVSNMGPSWSDLKLTATASILILNCSKYGLSQINTLVSVQVGAAWSVCLARDAERGTNFPTMASAMETGNKGILT